MTTIEPVVNLKPVVEFREFPFGTRAHPSMREAMCAEPWEGQDRVLEYLRAGKIIAYPMGADLLDWFARPNHANPLVDGERLGGVTPMTDGEWFWHAGLIYFIEKYNVRVSDEFLSHVARRNGVLHREDVPSHQYNYSYA